MRRAIQWLNSFTPQTVFLIVAGFFGAMFVFATPAIQVPDEPAHWYRVYQLSQGQLVGVKQISPGHYSYGAMVPQSVFDCAMRYSAIAFNPQAKAKLAWIQEELKRPLNPHQLVYGDCPSAALYSPVAYAPAAAFMMVARKLVLPPIELLFFGRMGTVVGYVVVGWFAIWVIPILKWPVVVLLCNPMALFLSASVSADPMTTAIVVLATAVALRCILLPGQLSWISGIALALAMGAVALCKPAYMPVTGLVFAISPQKWKGKWSRWLVPAMVIAVPLICFFTWSSVTHPQGVKERGDYPGQQLAWVTHHPGAFVYVCVHSAYQYWWNLFYSSMGLLGWVDTPLLHQFVDALAIAIIWLCVAYGEPVKVCWWPRLVAAIILLISIALIFLATYMLWNPVGWSLIEGLQGRYLLPLAPLAGIALHRRDGYTVRPAWIALLVTLVGTYTLWVIIERYYLTIWS